MVYRARLIAVSILVLLHQFGFFSLVGGQLFFRAGVKNSEETLPTIEMNASINDAKVMVAPKNPTQVGDSSTFKIACYRDHINAAQYDTVNTDGLQDFTSNNTNNSKTVQIDGGRMKVETGESIVIEATMGSIFLYVDDGDITTTTNWESLQMSMSVQLFQGCVSAETCLTGTDNHPMEVDELVVRTQRTKNGVRALDPSPNAVVRLRAHKVTRAENLENSNEYAEFVLDAGGNTGRFFFPELPEDDYFLVVNFDIVGITQSSVLSVGLGPHLIVAERFRAQGQVCINESELVTAQQFVPPPAELIQHDSDGNRHV